MTRRRWTRIAQYAAIAGGLAWLGKIASIVAHGGVGGPLEGPFFGLGLLLILVGTTGVATALPLRSRALLAVAVVASLVVGFFAVLGLLEPLGSALFAGLLPASAAGEEGILLVAVLALVVGASTLLLRPRRRVIHPA